jgi:hypothetical protein
MLTLGACGGLIDTLSGNGSTTQSASADKRPAVKRSTVPPKPGAPSSPAGQAASADGTKSCEAVSSTASPDELVGLDQQQLQQVLGAPATVSTNSPGKVWRYRNRCCELNVALYPNLQTKSYQVLSFEVISDDTSELGKRNCLAEFPGYATRRGTAGK